MKLFSAQLTTQLEQAQHYFNQHQFKKSLTLFLDILQVLPSHPTALSGAKSCIDADLSLDESNEIENLDLEMRLQEIKNPLAKRTRSRMAASYFVLAKKIQALLRCSAPEEVDKIIVEILQSGEEALWPLLDTVLAFKNAGKNAKKT